jgi:hypothetical protein
MKQVKAIVKLFNHEPLAEAFILEAITRYANDVLADDSDWGNSIISKQAWRGIAQAMKEHT